MGHSPPQHSSPRTIYGGKRKISHAMYVRAAADPGPIWACSARRRRRRNVVERRGRPPNYKANRGKTVFGGRGKAISEEEEEGEIPKFVEKRKQPSSAPFVKEEEKRRHHHHHHLLGHYPLRRIHQEWFLLLPPIMPRERETSSLPQPFRSAMLMVAQVAHSKRQGEVFVCTTPTEGREGGRALIL